MGTERRVVGRDYGQGRACRAGKLRHLSGGANERHAGGGRASGGEPRAADGGWRTSGAGVRAGAGQRRVRRDGRSGAKDADQSGVVETGEGGDIGPLSSTGIGVTPEYFHRDAVSLQPRDRALR